MLKHYLLGIALQCFCSFLFAQPCTLTQANLVGATNPYTIPAGTVLCITSNFCLGAASNFPGACANTGPSSLIINGVLRIAENVTFNFQGSINGSGEIQISDRGRISLFGSVNCSGGLQIKAVNRTLGSGTSTTVMTSPCTSGACEPTHADGYRPFGIVTPGLGYTTAGCILINYPSTGILVPVTFNSWQATAEGRGVRLNWSTASEQNNKGFEVQRSNVAGTWEFAGWVPSKAPEGNSASNLYYNFTDQQPGDLLSISYRLKQTDFDGNFKYSSLVRVEMLKAQDWRVRLEGCTVRVQVQAATTENVVIAIVGVSGNILHRKTYSLNAGSNTILIPAGNFSKGLQVVSMQRSGGELRREKILLK
ncbi:MAG: hypothetical protein ACTHMC_04555 [Pseudobacter sp.]|uniref:hypothetical protein n=1 Tax=Pseudobacter sp. TaxID=2045420 RepID=UPI003F7EF62E